jgi:hypothetical protein
MHLGRFDAWGEDADTDPDYLVERREVIVREFDTLIARLPEKWTGSGSLD